MEEAILNPRLLSILATPGGTDPLTYDRAAGELRTASGVSFAVRDGIPILLSERAAEEFVSDEDGSFYADGSAPQPSETYLGETPSLLEHAEVSPEWRANRLAFEHLDPSVGGPALQVGGRGIHAIRMAMAGSELSVNVTPILAEARLARAEAIAHGVGDRVCCVVGVAEELPFLGNAFSTVYSGGSIHHTDTTLSGAELARVLAPGGRFASVDPYRTGVYGLGRRLLGQREAVNCQPLESDRLDPLVADLPHARVHRVSPVVRYLLAALARFDVTFSDAAVRRAFRFEAAICRRGLDQRMGSAVVVTSRRDPTEPGQATAGAP